MQEYLNIESYDLYSFGVRGAAFLETVKWHRNAHIVKDTYRSDQFLETQRDEIRHDWPRRAETKTTPSR